MFTDASPYLEGETIYVPLRCLCESLGADVNWVKDMKMVEIYKDDIQIKVKPGGSSAYVNNKFTYMSAPVRVSDNGRIFLPARFIAETFGYIVKWDSASNTITITQALENSTNNTNINGNKNTESTNIISGPFDMGLYQLSLKMDSSIANLQDTKDNVSDKKIFDLSCKPLIMVSSQQNKNKLNSINSVLYNNNVPVIDGSLLTVTGKAVYLPIIDVLEAMGLPKENIKTTNNSLNLYIDKDNYIQIIKGQNYFTNKGINKQNFLYSKPIFMENQAILVTTDDLINIAKYLFNQPIKINIDYQTGNIDIVNLINNNYRYE